MRSLSSAIMFACLACILCCADVQSARADFKLRNLNPFARRSPGQLSTLQRLHLGTKRMAAKTANVLTLGKYNSNRKSTRQPVRVTGTQRTYRPGQHHRSTSSSAKEKSGMTSWLPGLPDWLSLKPEPEPGPTSVSEWLKQPRPGSRN